jgi:hypothetical protein
MELSINVNIEDEVCCLTAQFWQEDGFIVTDVWSEKIKIEWKGVDVSHLLSREQWNLIARQLDEKQPELIQMFMDA